MSKKEFKPIVCKGCALMLAIKCYEKHWWFHIVRDPLVGGMRFLGWVNGIDAYKHPVKKSECKGCIRFLKAELEQKSKTFNYLNQYIGPRFSNIRNNMLSEEELKAAKDFATEAMKETDSQL